MLPGISRLHVMFRGFYIALGAALWGVYLTIAGDELYCLPGGSRVRGKWAANIYVMAQHMVAKT